MIGWCSSCADGLKMEPDPRAPRYIVPVWRRNYRLVVDGEGK